MKRLMSILAACLIVVMLTGCGNSSGTSGSTTELQLNTVIETENFDFSITDLYFSDRATDPDNDSSAILANDGYCYANIVFDVNYKGKQDTTFPSAFGTCTLYYGDGYSFSTLRDWFYSDQVDAWLNRGDIKALSPNFGVAYNIEVPVEVRDNTEEPLYIVFSYLGTDYKYSYRQ